jgi:hypothetical protein
MDPDERAGLLAELRRYTEMLSETVDPKRIAGLEYLIRRCEEKLAAMGLPPASSPSFGPALRR